MRACKAITVLLVVAGLSTAYGLLKAYEVEPVKAQWSGWTDTMPPNNRVSQTVTCCWDSTVYVELFTGQGSGEEYQVDMLTYPGGFPVAEGYRTDPRSYVWVHFDLNTTYPESIIRGRKYEIRFTRAGQARLNYYFQHGDPYPYGKLRLGGYEQTDQDLCMRVYAKAGVDGIFAVQSVIGWKWGSTEPFDMENWPYCIEREDEVGVQYDKLGYGFWSIVQPVRDSWRWWWMDSLVGLFARSGVQPTMSLCRSATDWSYGTVSWKHGVVKNLYFGVMDSNNYLARYVYEMVYRYGPRGQYWQEHNVPYKPLMLYECASEPAVAAFQSANSDPRYHWKGYWMYEPDSGWLWITDAAYRRIYDEWRDRYPNETFPWANRRKGSFLEVYSRYVIVVDSAVKWAASELWVPEESIPRIAGYCVCPSQENSEGYSPSEWLEGYEEYGVDEFFDVASYHSYHDVPEDYEPDLNGLRYEFNDIGFEPRTFWHTEAGWPTVASTREGLDLADTLKAIRLVESYALMQAANALPAYSLEQLTWFVFTARYLRDGQSNNWWHRWGITDSTPGASGFRMFKPAYAYQQWRNLSQDASFEERLPSVNPQDPVQILQYEDGEGRKMWISWRQLEFPTTDEPIRIPACSPVVDTFRSAYDANPGSGPASCEQDGWLELTVNHRPIIVVEQPEVSRPDLVVDSVVLVPEHPFVGGPLTIKTWVRNHGNRATPGYMAPDSVDEENPTRVSFYCNEEPIGEAIRSRSIGVGETAVLEFFWPGVPPHQAGPALFYAVANQDQEYVELDMGDNAGYAYAFVEEEIPEAALDVIVPPGGSNVSRVLLMMMPGEIPPDSVMLCQEYYGLNDSLQGQDSTAWFEFVADTSSESWCGQDTCWQFLFGEGEYKFWMYCMDSSGGITSYSYMGHSEEDDSVVVFDTTPPYGSIVINSGDRFTNEPWCMITSDVSDTLAGVMEMRFANRYPSNLLANSWFDPGDGVWEFSGPVGYDNLGMVEMDVNPGQEGLVRQFVPRDSIWPHMGPESWMCLSMDMLMRVHDTTWADVWWWRFGYWYTNIDTAVTDTLWEWFQEMPFGPGLWSAVGQCNLMTDFPMPEPCPDSIWDWQGGLVEVRLCGAPEAQGKVWFDNMKLEPFGPWQEYSGWMPYDTLAGWELFGDNGWRPVYAVYKDEAGVENTVPLVDSIILDMDWPDVFIDLPWGCYVNGMVDIPGWAYDPIIVEGDTFFEWRRMCYRHMDSTEWAPVDPDSVSYEPAYPDWESPCTPAVHLGYWNTESLPSGEYWLKLVAKDSAGNESEFETWVVVLHVSVFEICCDGPDGGGEAIGPGSVFVGSRTGNVLHLSEGLDSLGAFAVADSGRAAHVTALLSLGQDSLLVADARGKGLLKMNKQGRNRKPLIPGLGLVSGLCRDGAGNIWVCDKGRSLVAKFRRDGSLGFTRGGPGSDSVSRLKNPEAIVASGKHIYVADYRNDRVAVWDTSGEYVTSITGDFKSPQALGVTDSGQVYLLDQRAGAIVGLNKLGKPFFRIQPDNSAPLRCLCLSTDQHHLFTLRPKTNQVVKYRIRSDDSLPGGGGQSGGRVHLPKRFVLYQPYPNPSRQKFHIRYGVPKTARVAIRVYDICGRTCRTLVNQEQKPGFYSLVWNRKDDKGREAAAGIYFCRLETPGFREQKKLVLVK